MVILLLLAYPLATIVLPGYVLSRWVWPCASPLRRVATSLGFGIITVGPLAYLPPFLLRTPLTPWWTALAATLVTLTAGLLLWRRPRASAAEPVDNPAEDRVVAGFVVAACIASALTMLPRWFEATNVWSPCPHQAAMYLMDNNGDGLTAYDPTWPGDVSHLVNRGLEPAFGLAPVLKRQRIGSAATLVHAIAFHGTGGLVVAAFIYTFLNVAFAALLIARGLRNRWAALALISCYLAAVRYAAFYMVNESALAAGLAAMALWLLLPASETGSETSPGRDTRASGAPVLLAGAALALCVATRPFAATFFLGALWLLGLRPRAIATLLSAAALCFIPWGLTQYQAFGSPFFHPSLQHANTAQTVWGMTVNFHPLNWPLTPTLLRPADSPIPNLLLVPLEAIQGFGALFMVTVAAGLTAFGWRRLVGLLLWAGPSAALLMGIVWLDHDKLSYALLAFAPLAVLAGAGAQWLITGPWTTRRLVPTGIVALVVLIGVPELARQLSFTVDSRPQYHDGPNRWDRTPENEQLEAMTSWGLLPEIGSLDDISWAFERTTQLLSGAAPAQLGAGPIERPMLVWAEQFPVDRTFDARILETPELPAYAFHPEQGTGPITQDYLALSLRVPGLGQTAAVHFTMGDGQLTVAVKSPGGDPGYLTLGINGAVNALQQVVVTVDGAPQGLTYHVMADDRSGDRFLRLVANHPARYEPTETSVQLRPEPPPALACGTTLAPNLEAGPATLLDTRAGRVVTWQSPRWPPNDPPCPNFLR